MNKKVITFYDPSIKIKDVKLVKMWCKNWEYYGWNTEVKNLKDAFSCDPIKYSKWEKSINLYKGSWDRKYIFICYARWLPMAIDGGVMVDSDVFNYGFTPKDCDALKIESKVLHLSGDCVPCATIGIPRAYEKYVQAFDEYDSSPYLHNNLKEYVHDMHIISSKQELYDPSIKLCSLYGADQDWDQYPLVHFTHGRVPFPRSRYVDKIRPFEGRVPSLIEQIGSRLLRRRFKS